LLEAKALGRRGLLLTALAGLCGFASRKIGVLGDGALVDGERVFERSAKDELGERDIRLARGLLDDLFLALVAAD
jgi:hypothetical protein